MSGAPKTWAGSSGALRGDHTAIVPPSDTSVNIVILECLPEWVERARREKFDRYRLGAIRTGRVGWRLFNGKRIPL